MPRPANNAVRLFKRPSATFTHRAVRSLYQRRGASGGKTPKEGRQIKCIGQGHRCQANLSASSGGLRAGHGPQPELLVGGRCLDVLI